YLEDRRFIRVGAVLPRASRRQRAGVEPASQALLAFRQTRIADQEDSAGRANRQPGLQRGDAIYLPATRDIAQPGIAVLKQRQVVTAAEHQAMRSVVARHHRSQAVIRVLRVQIADRFHVLREGVTQQVMETFREPLLEASL